MRPSEAANPATWSAKLDRAAPGRGTHGQPRDATSTRAVIVSSLFLVLFTIALMIGGHAAVDPLLRMAKPLPSAGSGAVAEVVVPMPDGQFCRHMSYDNGTAELIEGTIERCPRSPGSGASRGRGSGFIWGGR